MRGRGSPCAETKCARAALWTEPWWHYRTFISDQKHFQPQHTNTQHFHRQHFISSQVKSSQVKSRLPYGCLLFMYRLDS